MVSRSAPIVSGSLGPVSWGEGHLDVFWRGTDGNLWHRWFYERQWNGPENLGCGPMGSKPAPVSWGRGRLDVFWKGTDDDLWHSWFQLGSGWNGPESLGSGPLGSDPVPVSWGEGHLDVFWDNHRGHLLHRWWYDRQWHDPQALGSGPSHKTWRKDLGSVTGWAQVDLDRDGTLIFSGHAHNDALFSEAVEFRVRVLVGREKALWLQHSGHLGGLGATAAERNDWWEETEVRSDIALNFDDIADAESFVVYESRKGAVVGPLFDTVTFIRDMVLGATLVTTSTALIIFAGSELASLAVAGDAVPAAQILSGTLFLKGPQGTLFGLYSARIALIGRNQRFITQEEYDWANQQVFADTLPPPSQILITDSIGGYGNPFTFPSFDGTITVNVGNDFSSPRTSNAELFIHELVHVWQIYNWPDRTKWCLSGIFGQISANYEPGPEPRGRLFHEYNIEQQATIVERWFGRKTRRGGVELATDPWARYIDGNIRIGDPGLV